MSDWISVKDSLPEEGQEVLVSTKSKNGQRNVDKGYYLPEKSRFAHRGKKEEQICQRNLALERLGQGITLR